MSDDRKTAITIIAMLGSVFSPYYARARERLGAGGAGTRLVGVGDPNDDRVEHESEP